MNKVEVTHVSPSTFGSAGVWGGGERYSLALALAMSEHVSTRLVVFGPGLARRRLGKLEICELPIRMRWKEGSVNPVSERLALFLALTKRFHAHQYHSVVTNALLLGGAVSRRAVFATDHGGASHNYADRLRLDRLLTGFLPVSHFSASFFPHLSDRTATPIYGGADTTRFHPGDEPRRRQIVYVGRLMPHKGIDVLLQAVDDQTPVRLFGRTYDPGYRALLGRLADGKNVVFEEHASDAQIAAAYRGSRVAVLPSVHHSIDGTFHPWPELMGLTLFEAMASGTPVIASRVGGMPEVVSDGETGYLFDPGSVEQLRERLYEVLDGSTRWQAMSRAAVESVRARFTWERVAERCLTAYGQRG